MAATLNHWIEDKRMMAIELRSVFVAYIGCFLCFFGGDVPSMFPTAVRHGGFHDAEVGHCSSLDRGQLAV